MPSINLDLNYFEHPKTKRLIALVGKGGAEFPIRLWAYCGKYHMGDGVLLGYSWGEIEEMLNWRGKKGLLVESMLKVGFLDIKDDIIFVHDWLINNGHLKEFKDRATNAARIRWGRSSNATSMPQALPEALPQAMPLHYITSNTSSKRIVGFIGLKEFEKVWERYPAKDGKKQAFSHFKNSVKTETDFKNIETALNNYLKSDRVKKGFVKNGSTWFNNWQDWINFVEPEKEEIKSNGKFIPVYNNNLTDKKSEWAKKGLSSCHGKIIEDHDGIKRCAECLGEQQPPIVFSMRAI